MLQIPVLPESAPFNAEQRLWLNGFLAGYFSRMDVPASAPPAASAESPTIPLRILFGSQTGTAQTLAKRIGKEAGARGFRVQVTDTADYSKIDWASETNVFIVTSTYGDGDMPDNAQPFWDWLNTGAVPSLSHIRFAVLALGDRNYSEFCAAGRKLDRRFEELGAHRLCARVDCDVDYEAQAKAWMEEAFGSLSKSPGGAATRSVAPTVTNGSATVASNGRPNGSSPSQPAFSKTNPFPARLLANLRLSGAASQKEVRHYELSLQDSGLSYEPGDALGVLPANCADLVQALLAVVRCTGDEPARLGHHDMTLRQALTRHLDITKPTSELLRVVAQRSGDIELNRVLAPDRRDELRRWLWGRDVIDVLALLPHPLPAEELPPLFSKLAPRLYSICSSPKAHPCQVHLTVSTVRYEAYGRHRKGVASTFLADRLTDADFAKVFVHPSRSFKLPQDPAVPIIMVGPGTGIAPFRAFLEERQACGATGRNWLLFGDQTRQSDFLYEEQLNGWLQCGLLTRLDLAFSRDQADKIYVQDRMMANATELWSWLQDGAHFYVCGDASRMAKDVDAALHRIAESAGGKAPEDAKAWVSSLKAEKRYQRDVY